MCATTVTVGTGNPDQNVFVLLDTGSFELSVNPVCNASNVPEFCEAFGCYDASQSPTSKNLGMLFTIQYGSGRTAGTYYKDISISGCR